MSITLPQNLIFSWFHPRQFTTVIATTPKLSAQLLRHGYHRHFRNFQYNHHHRHPRGTRIIRTIMSSTSTSASEVLLHKPAQLALKVFFSGVESVKPKTLLRDKFVLDSVGERLEIQDGHGAWTEFELQKYKKIYVVGFGKAVLPMAEQVKAVLGSRVVKCLVNIPVGFRDTVVEGIDITRGAQGNFPDEAALKGTKNIVELVTSLDGEDLLIVLITGGGSALLTYPLPSITLPDYASLVKKLSRGGATIQELNTVRKRLSVVKGGGLASLCKCSTIASLILSDVLGDPLDLLASGPTVPNPDPPTLAKTIAEKYTTLEELPDGIKEALLSSTVLHTSEPDKKVHNVLIGNNTVAVTAASETAESLALLPFIWSKTLDGDASHVGQLLARAAVAIDSLLLKSNVTSSRDSLNSIGEALRIDSGVTQRLVETLENVDSRFEGVCILLGGETTVKVKGTGVGGRNQELVLSAAITLDSIRPENTMDGKVAVLSAGTDGYDGPCDAAGAVLDSSMVQNGINLKLPPPSHYLDSNDSYNYFKSNSKGAYHIMTGHTETNVMDLVVLVVLK